MKYEVRVAIEALTEVAQTWSADAGQRVRACELLLEYARNPFAGDVTHIPPLDVSKLAERIKNQKNTNSEANLNG